MENLKIRVANEAESREAQELFFELGASLGNGDKHAVLVPSIVGLAVVDDLINFVFNDVVFADINQCEEINLPELRGIVLFKNETLNDKVASAEAYRQAEAFPFNTDMEDFVFEDNVNHPNHYASSSIECIDAMEAMLTPEQFVGYLRGNMFKYQWRYENKNGIEDLKKSQWYLNKLLAVLEQKQ